MRYDVIIVGSGPAGSSTALHLAQINPALARRTLVLERDKHPRHKLCGGGCVPDVYACLEKLGLDAREVPQTKASWGYLHYQGRGFRMRFFADHSFRVVRRNEFDGWLARNVRDCGVELKEETRVLAVRRVPGGAEVETDRGTFTAPVVVGADGASSLVRRAVCEGVRSSNVARLVEVLTPEAPPDPAQALEPGASLMEFGWTPRGIQGYVWSFPTQVGGRPMRNWGVYDSRVLPKRPMGGSLRPVITEWLAGKGYRLDDYELEGHPIRLFDRRDRFAAPNMLLAGDAAGVDAVFGEGISPALGYGELAAWSIDDAFARDDFSFATYRQRVLGSPLGRSLSRRAWSARQINRLSHPFFQKLMWWRSGPLIAWYIRHVLFNWAAPVAPPVGYGEGERPVELPLPALPATRPHFGLGRRVRSKARRVE
ncbi:MAG TPA: FAD-dependent monooxygenase [Pirellulales bacterium]|nr:FAD-dependent monooxygenase [Pirellulales bacterium]